MLSMMIVGFSYSQENSNNSSGSSFFSSSSESEKSLLNLEKKENPFLKKLEDKNKKNSECNIFVRKQRNFH